MITVITGTTQRERAFHSRRPELRYNDIFRYFCFVCYSCYLLVSDVSVLGLLYSSTSISLQDL